jgi:GTP-binding protein HflX
LRNEKVIVVLPHSSLKYMDEELGLIKSIYNNIVDIEVVRRPNPKYYITIPVLDRIKNSSKPDKLIIMDILRPKQMVNLMRELGIEIIDRPLLILEIFAEHAGSREAKLQIELARLRHEYPLIKEAIRYAKLGELHGFLGGGRYGYEKYHVMLKEREARVRREIEKLRRMRNVRSKRRLRENAITVSILGYTCAGKTTLFNALTRAGKPVGPEPFTTLSPKTSSIIYNGVKIYFTDTVGFIRNLPPEIIDAFYATLEEAVYSDIIIVVVDSSKTIGETLKEVDEAERVFERIGLQGKPVIIALNKIDLVDEEHLNNVTEAIRMQGFGDLIVPISAEKNINIHKLLNAILALTLEAGSLGENIRATLRTQAAEG